MVYRDPETGRFAKRPARPARVYYRDPETGRFAKRPARPARVYYRDPETGRFAKRPAGQPPVDRAAELYEAYHRDIGRLDLEFAEPDWAGPGDYFMLTGLPTASTTPDTHIDVKLRELGYEYSGPLSGFIPPDMRRWLDEWWRRETGLDPKQQSPTWRLLPMFEVKRWLNRKQTAWEKIKVTLVPTYRDFVDKAKSGDLFLS